MIFFKKKEGIKLSFYNKENEEHQIMLSQQKVNDYTKNIPVKDVKTYLKEEYDRAFEREELINTLQQRIEEFQKMEQKYNALLVIQDKKEERYKKQEENLIEEKKKTKKEKENNVKLSAKIADVMNNCKIRDQEITKLKKEINDLHSKNLKKEKEIKKQTKAEYRNDLLSKINNLSGHISKNIIIEIVKEN